jgi:carbon-monoxide dehydrogenase medium subunit
VQVPAPFEYARAGSVDDAVRLLTEHGPESRLVAGGHSLLPMMKLRLAEPEWLVDIGGLTELDYVRLEGEVVAVGAMTRHATLLSSELLGRLFPIVHDAERVIADPVVRNRGTIGGSLCQADPAEDLTTVCDVLGATLVVTGPGGTRTAPVADLHAGPYETTLGHDEVLTEVRLPVRPRSGSAYEKVERRVGDWAVTAAGAAVTLTPDGFVDDVAVGLTAVGLEGTVAEAAAALRGRAPSEELFAEAGRAAAAASRPTDDARGPVDYKRHLAGELTRRVLRRACERAAAEQEG